MTCAHCNEETTEPLLHLSECQQAPEDVRTEAKAVWAARVAYCKQETCCKLRKKLLLRVVKMSKEVCGIDDSECLDVMTFDQFQGLSVIQPRFCPWCGKTWVVTGLSVS